MAEEVRSSWPQLPETEEQKQARLREVSRKVAERFGHANRESERRCPQCAKKMIVEYAESPNELEPGVWVQSCWGCGYESRF